MVSITTMPPHDLITPIILDRSIPAFVNDYFPQFNVFLAAYYEWMEQTLQPHEIIQHLREYRDIDRTIDDFIKYFRHEVMVDIPTDIAADKRLVAKHIKSFYLNKGNEASYRFLFRILFNEDIDFYYPKNDILRASDGKWYQTVSIKILAAGIDSTNFFFTSTITGNTSHASALVQSVNTVEERGVALYELILNTIYGEFVAGETLTFTPDDSNHTTIIVEDVYYAINVIDQGEAYSIGDPIYLRDSLGNKIATGQVLQVGRGPVTDLTLVNGGTGYSGLLRDISNFAYLPLTSIYEGTELDLMVLNNNILITTDSDADVVEETQPISFAITPITISGTGDVVLISDTPAPIGQGATAVVSHVTETGTILAVELLTEGKDYSVPIAVVDSPEGGTGAVITVQGGGGAITQTELLNFPIFTGMDSDDAVTVDFSGGTGSGATGTPIAGAGTLIYPGYYLNSDGQPSSDKKLQDNYFYQDFSYVILSGLTQSRWYDIIQKAIHPAGLKAFGEIKFTVAAENGVEAVSAYAIQSFEDAVHSRGAAYAMTGHVPTMRATRVLPAATGAYTYTGKAANPTRDARPVTGTYAQTGHAATLYHNRVLTAAAGFYTQTGRTATFVKT